MRNTDAYLQQGGEKVIIIQAVRAAFSMYSRIPVGGRYFDERSMKYAFCFFPLIGCVIAAAELLWYYIYEFLSFGVILYAAVAAAIPVFISGGIHVDGFLDTCDALSSYGDTKKKLEILKDPNSGAFAVMGGIIYFMLTFAMFTEMGTLKQLIAAASGFVISRALSAAGGVCFKSARSDGLLRTFKDASGKRSVIISSCIYIIAAAAAAVFSEPVCGAFVLPAAALIFIHYRFKAYKEFGGVTGDLAGWFLVRCELAVLAAVVFSGILL